MGLGWVGKNTTTETKLETRPTLKSWYGDGDGDGDWEGGGGHLIQRYSPFIKFAAMLSVMGWTIFICITKRVE